MWPPSEEAAALGMSLGRRPLSEHLIGMVRQEHGEQQQPQLELAETQQPQQEQKRPWSVMSLAPTQRRA